MSDNNDIDSVKPSSGRRLIVLLLVLLSLMPLAWLFWPALARAGMTVLPVLLQMVVGAALTFVLGFVGVLVGGVWRVDAAVIRRMKLRPMELLGAVFRFLCASAAAYMVLLFVMWLMRESVRVRWLLLAVLAVCAGVLSLVGALVGFGMSEGCSFFQGARWRPSAWRAYDACCLLRRLLEDARPWDHAEASAVRELDGWVQANHDDFALVERMDPPLAGRVRAVLADADEAVPGDR